MKLHAPLTNFARRPRSEAGFTIIEMMISITIGLGILAGLVGVLSSTSGNSKSNDRTSELMTNGRYALNSLKQEVREAGFRAYTWAEPGTPSPYVGPTAGCVGAEGGATVAGFVANIRQGIWGSDNANPFSGNTNCIPDASYAAGNDVLVIRRLAVVPTAVPVANTVYFHSTYERGQVFRGATTPNFGASLPLASFAVQVYVYFIRPWTVSATESPMVPALCRSVLQADGTMATELVASGIERMQVQYGRLTTAPDTQYFNTLAGNSSDTASTAWDEVNSVRIWLLARNATPEPGYVNATTYPMGNVNPDYVPNDNFRRQMFSTVVQLRN